MSLSLKNIFTLLSVIFLLSGSIFVFISTQVFFAHIQSQLLIEDKTQELVSIAPLLLTKPNAVSGQYLAKDSKRAILETLSTESGVLFFRIVDRETKTIEISNNKLEEGSTLNGIPPLHLNTPHASVRTIDDVHALHATYYSGGTSFLWAGLDQNVYSPSATVLAIEQTLLVILLIILFVVLMLVALHYLVLRPLNTIQKGLRAISGGNLDTRLSTRHGGEFGAVFESFNTMAHTIQKLRNQDEHVSEMKSNFISAAAHQLRTPLTGIHWALTSLLSGDFGILKKKQEKMVSEMVKRNHELISIVAALLDSASIEEGRYGYIMGTFCMRDLLKELFVEYESERYAKDHVFKLIVPKGKHIPKAYGDRERMKWTIRNLIDNAIHYTPKNGEITVTLQANQKSLIISVSDTGIGIPKDEQKKLFQKFYRGTNAIRVKSVGNGLGLFIAKNIIMHHNGSIAVDSEENEGTTFTITVPIEVQKKQE